MYKNRQGFTLVELLIAMAIGSLLLITAGQFLTKVISRYNSDNEEMKLQTEVTDIVTGLQDWLMDATDPSVDEDVLTVTKTFDEAFESRVYLSDGALHYTTISGDVTLGKYVDSVKFSLTDNGVDVALELSNGAFKYSSTRQILLRNELSDGQALYADSYVQNQDGADSDDDIKLDGTVYTVSPGNNNVNYTAVFTNKGKDLVAGSLKYRFYYYYEAVNDAPKLSMTWTANVDSRAVKTVNHYVTSYSKTISANSYYNSNYGYYYDYNTRSYVTDFNYTYYNWLYDNNVSRVTYYIGYVEIDPSDITGLNRAFTVGNSLSVSLTGTFPNGYTNGYWQNYYYFSMDHSTISGFSDAGKPNVVVFYSGVVNPVWGTLPAFASAPKFSVSDSKITESGGKAYVSFTIQKTGMNLDWSQVKLYYYWIDNTSDYTTDGDRRYYNNQLYIENLSVSSAGGTGPSSATAQIIRPQDNADKFEGTNGYVIISFDSGKDSGQSEYVYVTFTVSCDDSSYISRTIKSWYTYTDDTDAVNNLKIYGIYSGDNACSFGRRPSGTFQEVKTAATVTAVGGAYTVDRPIEKIIISYTVQSTGYSSVVAYTNSNLITGCLGSVSTASSERYWGNTVEKTLALSGDAGDVTKFYLKANASSIQSVAVIYK